MKELVQDVILGLDFFAELYYDTRLEHFSLTVNGVNAHLSQKEAHQVLK